MARGTLERPVRSLYIFALTALAVQLANAEVSAAQSSGTLQVRVLDPSGAGVPDAAVTVTSANGVSNRGATDKTGLYRIDALPSGEYGVLVTVPAFEPFRSGRISIKEGADAALTVQLQIQQQTSSVTVSSSATAVSVDPMQNAGQIVLRGSDLDSFSDDPDDLANELRRRVPANAISTTRDWRSPLDAIFPSMPITSGSSPTPRSTSTACSLLRSLFPSDGGSPKSTVLALALH